MIPIRGRNVMRAKIWRYRSKSETKNDFRSQFGPVPPGSGYAPGIPLSFWLWLPVRVFCLNKFLPIFTGSWSDSSKLSHYVRNIKSNVGINYYITYFSVQFRGIRLDHDCRPISVTMKTTVGCLKYNGLVITFLFHKKRVFLYRPKATS